MICRGLKSQKPTKSYYGTRKSCQKRKGQLLNLPFFCYFLLVFRGICICSIMWQKRIIMHLCLRFNAALRLRSGWWEFWKNTTPCTWDLVSVRFLEPLEKGCFKTRIKEELLVLQLVPLPGVCGCCSHYSNHRKSKQKKTSQTASKDQTWGGTLLDRLMEKNPALMRWYENALPFRTPMSGFPDFFHQQYDWSQKNIIGCPRKLVKG